MYSRLSALHIAYTSDYAPCSTEDLPRRRAEFQILSFPLIDRAGVCTIGWIPRCDVVLELGSKSGGRTKQLIAPVGKSC